jgi:SsrA-binding protein
MGKVISTNGKAYRDYAIFDKIECGIELKGSEVKSLRAGRINLEDGFARVEEGEVILYNTHISPYAQASYLNVEPTRTRKLLLHKKQITKLAVQVTQKGYTLVPTQAYFNDRGLVKMELALCKGKKSYDKREDIKRRETDLELRRIMKDKRNR